MAWFAASREAGRRYPLSSAAEKLFESSEWQAKPPAPPREIKQLQRGGTGGFACRITFSAVSMPVPIMCEHLWRWRRVAGT